jgi:hypothetical protein
MIWARLCALARPGRPCRPQVPRPGPARALPVSPSGRGRGHPPVTGSAPSRCEPVGPGPYNWEQDEELTVAFWRDELAAL